jgi:hypothetical protein
MDMVAEPLKGKVHKQCIGFEAVSSSPLCDETRKLFADKFDSKDVHSAVMYLKEQIPNICVDLLSTDEERLMKKIDEAFSDVMIPSVADREKSLSMQGDGQRNAGATPVTGYKKVNE